MEINYGKHGRPKDIHGVELQDGDIVAEGKIGDIIWDGGAEIEMRPIGIFVETKPKLTSELRPELNDAYNIRELRPGSVKINPDKAPAFLKSKTTTEIYLSRYDGDFYGWDDIEIVGNIYDDYR